MDRGEETRTGRLMREAREGWTTCTPRHCEEVEAAVHELDADLVALLNASRHQASEASVIHSSSIIINDQSTFLLTFFDNTSDSPLLALMPHCIQNSLQLHSLTSLRLIRASLTHTRIDAACPALPSHISTAAT